MMMGRPAIFVWVDIKKIQFGELMPGPVKSLYRGKGMSLDVQLGLADFES